MQYPFQLVDVFFEQALSGNPLAVVHDADRMDDAEMLAITRWLNFSETTFLSKASQPGADYRVRIFTPQKELPFAGHPTLGTCHAWLENGGRAKHDQRVVQECAAGLIEIGQDSGMLAFAAPPLLRSGPVEPADQMQVAAFLGLRRNQWLAMEWVDNGPGWIAVLLPDAAAVRALSPAAHSPQALAVGVIGAQPPGSATQFEVRAFFTDHNGRLFEDPVTGSLNAGLAQWLTRSRRAQAPYVVAQGTCLQRDGRLFVSQDNSGQVWIGGRTRTLSSGRFHV